MLLGDFNVNLLKDSSFADNLKADYHLAQLISEPTRCCKTTSTLIDHLYISDRSLIGNSGVVQLQLSDHRAIFGTLSAGRVKAPRKIINYRSFRRIDAELFSSDMRTQPWCVLDAFDDIDDMTDAFNKLYLDV
jgi:hypothetical protein